MKKANRCIFCGSTNIDAGRKEIKCPDCSKMMYKEWLEYECSYIGFCSLDSEGENTEDGYNRRLEAYIKNNYLYNGSFGVECFSKYAYDNPDWAHWDNEDGFIAVEVHQDVINRRRKLITFRELNECIFNNEIYLQHCDRLVIELDVRLFRAIECNINKLEKIELEDLKEVAYEISAFVDSYLKMNLTCPVCLMLSHIECIRTLPLLKQKKEYMQLIEVDHLFDFENTTYGELKKRSNLIRQFLEEIQEGYLVKCLDRIQAQYFVYPSMHIGDGNVQLDSITNQYLLLSPLVWLGD